MRARRLIRGERRSRVALAATFLLAALAPMLASITPAARSLADSAHALSSQADTDNPIQVTLRSIRPIAPQPGDTLTLTGMLRNSTTAPISDVNYELKIGSTLIGTRGTFDQLADDSDGLISDLYPIDGTVTPGDPLTLQTDESEPFSLSVPVNDLSVYGLTATSPWQVRELGISVTTDIDGLPTVVGHLRTFLPWAPKTGSAGEPTGIAWIWPLVDRPHRTTATDWYDDDLATELGPTGRLTGLLNAGAAAETQLANKKTGRTPVPLTWAIDPMLVNDVKAMTSTYQVTTSTGTTTGTGTNAAKSWLAALHGAVTRPGASVLALPFGDPDVVAAVRAGLTTTLGLAAATGRTLLQQALGGTLDLLSTYAWPPGGLVDQHTVNALLASGDSTLILSDLAMQPTVATYTPSAPVDLSTPTGQADALLTDSTLSSVVSNGSDNPGGSRLALQRYLAETLMIHAEAPGIARDIVIAPNRRWEPSPGYAAKVLADTGKVPWITPVSLSEVANSTVANPVLRDPLNYPESARHNELSPAYLSSVRAVRKEIAAFTAILPTTDPQISDYTTAVWEALSSAWRSDPGLAGEALDRLSSAITTEMHQVRITSKNESYITLTSHGGKVPLTIANNLAVPVSVALYVNGYQRLTLDNHGRIAVPPIPPHQQVNVSVHAEAKTSGTFPITVQLLTPKSPHQDYGGQVHLYVRSTVYGTITLVITGAATAALMVAVAIRLTRRALAARRSSASDAPA